VKKALIICIILFSSSVNAWHQVGHRVVAAIAYKNLNEAVKIKVDSLLSTISNEYPDYADFIMSASWPDLLAIQGVYLYSHWHYINLIIVEGNGDYEIIQPDKHNVVWAINQLKNNIANNKLTKHEQARLLMFLIHITGDLHQPLHAAEYFSVDTPKGDRGGNLFKVRAKNPPANDLHTLWDQALGAIIEDDLSNPASKKLILIEAKKIMEQFPISYFQDKIYDIDAYHWAKESHQLAQDVVYHGISYGGVPSNHYIEQGQRIAKQQIALAGYRLSVLLNAILS
jgi:S1/P1 Nuclease